MITGSVYHSENWQIIIKRQALKCSSVCILLFIYILGISGDFQTNAYLFPCSCKILRLMRNTLNWIIEAVRLHIVSIWCQTVLVSLACFPIKENKLVNSPFPSFPSFLFPFIFFFILVLFVLSIYILALNCQLEKFATLLYSSHALYSIYIFCSCVQWQRWRDIYFHCIDIEKKK
jgi:hypothetical protein